MIKMTARKALGGMHYEATTASRNRALVLRRLEDFKEAAGPEHCAKVSQTIEAIERDMTWADIENDIRHLIELMPPYTYGEVLAGTIFRMTHSPYIYIKRKGGREVIGRDELLPHLQANDSVIVIDIRGV